MTDAENNHPSRLRRAIGIIAGAATSALIYSAEAYVGYVSAEIIRAGFQSPDTLPSLVSILCVLGIAALGLYDLNANRGTGLRGVLFSGVRAGQTVYQAVLLDKRPLN